jgi:quercetin dioxygenase-like cupin family protein
MMKMNAIAKIKSAGEALWFGNTLVSIKLASDNGDDGVCVIEHWMPFGESPPLHVHRNEDEIFHILEGRMRFSVDGREITATAGETVLAPKGIPHTFRVESEAGAHCLTVTRGIDFESMVRQASRPAERADLPAPLPPSDAMIEFLVKICAENGIDIVGPPLA